MYKKPKHFRPPLGGQVGAKIHQKSFQEPSKPYLNLHLVSDSLLHRILIDFFMIFDPQNNKKTIKNHSTNHPNSTRSKNQKSVFRIGRAIEFVPSAMSCYDEKSIKMVPRSLPKPLSNQHPNLHRFLFQLGSILGGLWEPSWSQVGTKLLQKSIQKVIQKMITFWIALGIDFDRFWSQLGGLGGGESSHFSHLLLVSWCLLGPRCSPDPSKTLQESSRDRFW